MATTATIANYISWRSKLRKGWNDGGPTQVTHLTLHRAGNGKAPYALCGRRIPGYALDGTPEATDEWSYIPEGPTKLCKRCERADPQPRAVHVTIDKANPPRGGNCPPVQSE